MRRFGGDVWAADKLLVKEADAGQVVNEEATLHIRGSIHSLDTSVLGLGGGAVPSLGGGAMNLASLLGGGGGFKSQINPVVGVLGGSTGLLGTAGVPNELAGSVCTLGQPTKPQCDFDELASRRATAGDGGSEGGDREASGCAGTGED